jgi:predicted RNase H-like nuclease (RuvC/YqgF family)
MRENKKLKKTIKSNERRAKASKEEHDALLKQLEEREELISRYGNDKEDETERTEGLLAQKRSLEKELRMRGEDIIQLRRDARSQIKLTNAQKAAEEGKRLLLTRIGGMFAHYRSLHEKNAALVAKLTAMARAGGFGNHGSVYRKELANLTGVSLEDLPEYKATL